MNIIQATAQNFEQEVLRAKQTVLADFNACWCAPCRLLAPVFEELAAERKDVKFVSVDVDREHALASAYRITSVPCLIVFQNGIEKHRAVGFRPKAKLNALIGGT